MPNDPKKKLDKASRRKLKKARKTKRTSERDRSWQDSLLTDQEGELASTFKRIVSRHDRRRREVDLAREVLREILTAELPPGAVEGVVIEIVPGGCIVQSGSETVRCVLRGLLKSLETKEQNIIAVGDRVAFVRLDGATAVVERVYPRRTILSRKYMEREHVVAANVDQLVIVASVAEPPLRTGLIDRYLVSAERGELAPTILVNKIDLAEDESYRAIMQTYAGLGYRVICCSVETGEGLDDVRAALAGKTSILAGQSGVGKSSILNALQPGLELRVADVSEATSKGTHTTTSVRLLALEFGGYVVDTPGIREFALWDVSRQELAHCFREFHAHQGTCRLRGCTHTHEPGCEVKAALEQGAISRERYDSYCRLYESLEK